MAVLCGLVYHIHWTSKRRSNSIGKKKINLNLCWKGKETDRQTRQCAWFSASLVFFIDGNTHTVRGHTISRCLHLVTTPPPPPSQLPRSVTYIYYRSGRTWLLRTLWIASRKEGIGWSTSRIAVFEISNLSSSLHKPFLASQIWYLLIYFNLFCGKNNINLVNLNLYIVHFINALGRWNMTKIMLINLNWDRLPSIYH